MIRETVREWRGNNGRCWRAKQAAGYMFASGDVSEGVTMEWSMKRRPLLKFDCW